ncbi:hypothetical protein HZ326_27629 [Fusarium oxysporum f. sp. albedinis]|nr:hypothetical protein HZ326_27629 [Fusarium oxysporum f. sp. albedinis]
MIRLFTCITLLTALFLHSSTHLSWQAQDLVINSQLSLPDRYIKLMHQRIHQKLQADYEKVGLKELGFSLGRIRNTLYKYSRRQMKSFGELDRHGDLT